MKKGIFCLLVAFTAFVADAQITPTSFAPAVTLPAGNSPIQCALVDLQADGKPDLVVANYLSSTVSFYRNQSVRGSITAGSFAAALNHVVGTEPHALEVGDIDGDNRPDIVTCNLADNTISILDNGSAGGTLMFGGPIHIPIPGQFVRATSIGDLDGDGRNDIAVVALHSDNLILLRNIGSSNVLDFDTPFVIPNVGDGPHSVQIADIDGDTRNDIVVGNFETPDLIIMRRVGPINPGRPFQTNDFIPSARFSHGGNALDVRDIDGDGRLDIAIGHWRTHGLAVYRNTSTPGSISLQTPVEFDLGNSIHHVAIRDLDADLKPELVLVGELDSYMSIYKNLSIPGASLTVTSFAARVQYPSGWNAAGVTVGDIDGDTRPDIAFANSYDNTLSLYQNLIGTNIALPPIITQQPASQTVEVGGTALFHVEVAGTPPFGFRWRRNGVNVQPPSLGTDTLIISNVQPSHAGIYDVIITNVANPAPGIRSSNAVLTVVGAPTNPPPPPANLIALTSTWSYDQSGADLGTAWSQPGYDDSAWPEGMGVLGVEIAPLPAPINTPLQLGSITYYFRNTIDLSPSQVSTQSQFQAHLLIDDGAVLYVNGTEVIRVGMPSGPPTFNTLAARTVSDALLEGPFTIPAQHFVAGPNVIAVEVHQSAIPSSDIVFGMTLNVQPGTNNLVPPTITQQPQSQSVPVGGTAIFHVEATGTQPLGYRWRRNGLTIVPVGTDTLIISNVQPSDAGTYSVVITNAANPAPGVLSSPAVLTVLTNPPPPPAGNLVSISNIWRYDQSGADLGTAWISPAYDDSAWPLGPAPLGFESSPLPVPINTMLNIGPITYYFRTHFNLTEAQLNPLSQFRAHTLIDDGAVFYVNGAEVLRLRLPPGPVSASTLASIPPTGDAVFEGPFAIPADRFVAGDNVIAVEVHQAQVASGDMVFGMTLNVQPGDTNPPPVPPTIIEQPQSQTVLVGGTAIFQVEVTGTEPFGYRWRRNGVNIPGATSDTLVISNAQPDHAGIYTVIITNPANPAPGVLSAPALLTVIQDTNGVPPIITSQPSSGFVLVGSTGAIVVEAAGTPPLSYQWFRNGQLVPGETNPVIIPPPFSLLDNGAAFFVVVSNPFGSVTSDTAIITVVDLPPDATPVITSISPVSGPVGTEVTISGRGFEPTQNFNQVRFGGVATELQLLSVSSTQIVTRVPFGAAYAPVTVTVNGMTAISRQCFDVTFPSIQHLEPSYFGPRQDLPAGNTPIHMASGDFDNDGLPDLVVLNHQGSTATIYRNNGLSMDRVLDLPTGPLPYMVAVADFDGDWLLDLATADRGGNTVSVFRNISAGLNVIQFGPRQSALVGSGPICLAVGDLNRDGFPDIATGDYDDGTVSVLLSLGGVGNFRPRRAFNAGGDPHAIGIADFSGDGIPDIVTANYLSGALAFLRGTVLSSTNAVFVPRVLFPGGGNTLAICDINDDGRPDVVTGHYANSALYIYAGTTTPFGTNIFAPRLDFQAGTTPHQVALGDLDGDGRPDICASGESPSAVSLFRNTSSGGVISLAPRVQLFAGPNETGLVVVDINRDSKPDITVANAYANSISIFRNAIPREGVPPPQPGLVIPSGLDNIEGLGGSGVLNEVNREQTIYATGHFPPHPILIHEIRFRPNIHDGTPGHSFTGGISRLQINLSTSSSDFDDLNPNFAANIGPDEVVVFDGPLAIASRFEGPDIGPKQFDIVVPLQRPFFYNPVAGKLLVDIRNHSGGPTLMVDAENRTTDAASRLVAPGNANAVTGAPDTGADVLRLGYTIAGTNQQPPVITRQPVNQTVPLGGTANFSVDATGSLPLSYQWNKNNNPIPGATNRILTISGVTTNDAGFYSVLVSNSAGSILSAAAELRVTTVFIPAAPMITSFTPQTGPTGTVVTINGMNFSPNPLANRVSFGAVRARILSGTSQSLVVEVPIGATFEPISVVTSNRTAFADRPFVVTFESTHVIHAESFGPSFDLPAGDLPMHVALGDINRDGRVDFVIPNYFSGNIGVYLNNSTNFTLEPSSFAPPVYFPTGPLPFHLTLADLDADNRLDAITPNFGNNTISILRNISTPTNVVFLPPINLPAGGLPTGVAVGDLNKDGLLDIVVANQESDSISIFRRIGSTLINSNSFAPRIDVPIGDGPHAILLGDVDGDLHPDIIVANYLTPTLAILRVDPVTGLANAPVHFPRGGNSLAFGDLDRDGRQDIAVVDYASGILSIFRNIASPGFIGPTSLAAPIDINTGHNSYSLAFGDVDGDARLDIVVVGEAPDYMSIYQNLSSPGALNISSFGPRVDFASGANPHGIGIGDLDRDSRPDIVFANAYDDNVTIYKNFTIRPGLPPNGVPVARATASPALDFLSDADTFVILAPDSVAANVLLDGSQSTDPEGQPLTYDWTANGTTLGSGALLPQTLAVGNYEVVLRVSDGIAAATDTINVEVIQPAAAVQRLVLLLDQSPLPRQSRRPIIATLKVAVAALEDGRDAINLLETARNKIDAQVAPDNPELAGLLNAAIQEVIDALSATP